MSEFTYGDFRRALQSSRKDDCYRYVSQLEKDRDRLRAEVEELVGALRDLRTNAALLQQNAEGCATNHYPVDFAEQGFPGWLTDTRSSIERAAATLAKHEARDA